MTRKTKARILELMREDKDLKRELVKELMQEVLEAEMTELLGAAKTGTHIGSAWLSSRLLRTGTYYSSWQDRASCSAGSRWSFQH